jgi:hypothetical protein
MSVKMGTFCGCKFTQNQLLLQVVLF